MDEVLIVPTGIANTASVIAAFTRLGTRPRLCDDATQLAAAPRLVLPGVGTFAAAMQRLTELRLVDLLRERIEHGRATLAICLGMQLLCTASEESPGTRGLALIDATLRRFAEPLRVPQLGWNQVATDGDDDSNGCALLEPGCAYFANTYRLTTAPSGWRAATTNYGGPFTSALERGAVLACQFHPEISGDYGKRLLARWLMRSREAS